MTDEDDNKDEQAVGRTMLLIIKHPKRVVAFLSAVVVGLAGVGVWRESSRPRDKVLTILEQVQEDVVETRVTTGAILETLPTTQKARAKQIIDLQLAAIKMARRDRKDQ